LKYFCHYNFICLNISFIIFLFLGNIAPAGDPKELYKDQNQQLKDMGFINEELNYQVLQKTFGNVDAAVERLLNMMN